MASVLAQLPYEDVGTEWRLLASCNVLLPDRVLAVLPQWYGQRRRVGGCAAQPDTAGEN